MKLRKVKIVVEGVASTKRRWGAALKGKHAGFGGEVISVPSWEVLGKVFSPPRLEILAAIPKLKPPSIAALAKALKRDFKNVHADVTFLAEVGLLTLRETRGRRTLVPTALYSEIDLPLPPGVRDPRPDERSTQRPPDPAFSRRNVRPRTVLFVGSGGLENAWAPIRLALEEVYRFVPMKEGENLAFASLIFQLRWLAAMVHSGGADRAQFESLFQSRLQAYNDLKRGIASRLTRAVDAGEVRVRPEARQLDRYLEPPLLVVTTNWCKSVERFWPNAKVLHLHGTIDAPDTLYLPTESIEEPYRTQPVRPSFLAEAAAEAMAGLHVCSRLVVYGLSLSPLDPELGIVLSDGIHGRSSPLTDAFVIDLNPALIAERLRFYGVSAATQLRPPEDRRQEPSEVAHDLKMIEEWYGKIVKTVRQRPLTGDEKDKLMQVDSA